MSSEACKCSTGVSAAHFMSFHMFAAGLQAGLIVANANDSRWWSCAFNAALALWSAYFAGGNYAKLVNALQRP